MCLTIESHQLANIAQEDITVWKVYRKTEKYLLSYYQEVRTNFGEQPTVEFGIVDDENDEGYSAVEEGYHSFKNLEDALKFYRTTRTNNVLIECTIPKGSQYYLGTFGVRQGYKCYASNNLIVENYVPENI